MTPLVLALAVLGQEPPPPPPPPPPAVGVPSPTAPPLVGLPLGREEPPAPPLVQPVQPLSTPLEPPRAERPLPTSALHFNPLSLFGLYLGVEYERGISESFTFFVAAGAGPFGQLGGDLGCRWYVGSTVLDGLFLDGHVSFFAVPAGPLAMIGPGATLGYTWRLSSRAVLSLGVGATSMIPLARQTAARGVFFGGQPADTAVLVFPGLQQPPRGQPAFQPTLRFTVGPGL